MTDDPRLGIGGNFPPAEPTPFERACEEVNALYGEAALWLDGAQVESQGVADGLATLIAMLREAVAFANEARKAENEPFDTGKAEVQARYNPLLQKADLAMMTCKNALAPWLDAIDRAQREAAEEARRVAAEKAKAADAQANRIERAPATAATGGRAIGLRTTYQPQLTDMVLAARHYWKVERAAFEEF